MLAVNLNYRNINQLPNIKRIGGIVSKYRTNVRKSKSALDVSDREARGTLDIFSRATKGARNASRHRARSTLDVSYRKAKGALDASREGVIETVYPTRCAICDAPGVLICQSCMEHLPYVDMSWACKKCGAAWGYFECCECNPLTCSQFGLDAMPYDDCISALHSNAMSRRIVSAYKDAGERRLASVIANIMSEYISREVAENVHAITYIPARLEACKRRGFDHMQLVAHCMSEMLNVQVATTLTRPHGRDQRELGRLARMSNTQNLFCVHPNARVRGANLLLIDDVMTTGSTLISAASALRDAGVSGIHVRTFARA